MIRFTPFLICLISLQTFAQSSIAELKGSAYDDRININTPWTLTTGSSFFSTTSQIFSEPTVAPQTVTGCDGNMSYATNTFRKVDELGITFMKVACQEADKVKATKKLDPQICMQLASCLSTQLKSSDADRFSVLKKAREETAAEAVALVAASSVQEMINFEELKTYAFQKYGADSFPEECSNIDPLKIPEENVFGSTCRTKIIDRGFDIAQRTCQSPDIGCQLDYLDYTKGKKTEEGKSSLLASFIKDQSLKRSKNFMEQDTRLTQEMSRIMTDQFLSPAERARKTIAFLTKNHSQLDPIFKSYFDTSMTNRAQKKHDDLEESLVTYIKKNTDKNALEVLVDLERLRKSAAHEMLKNKCGNVLKMDGLCKIASDVMMGAEVVVPTDNFNRLLSRKDGLSKNPKMNREDLVQYVARCNIFVLDSGAGGYKSTLSKLSSDRDLFTTVNGNGLFMTRNLLTLSAGNPYGVSTGLPTIGMQSRTTYTLTADGAISKKDSMFAENAEKVSGGNAPERNSESVLIKRFSNNLPFNDNFKKDAFVGPIPPKSLEKIDLGDASSSKKEEAMKYGTAAADSFSSMQAQQNLMQTRQAVPNTRPINNLVDTSIDFTAKAEAAQKANAGNVDYNALINKISGLEDKLAQAQKKSASGSSSSESEVKADSKTQEENDLMKELKNAKTVLNDLNKTNAEKKANEKSLEANNSTGASGKSNSREESSNISPADASVISSGSSSSGQASRAVASAAPAAHSNSSNGISSESSSERGSSGSSDEVRSSSRGASAASAGENSALLNNDGAVLTRLDGIGHNKVNETINNMIVSESGKPFYIEEGGLVKQIIPEVVDGKILFNENGTPVYKTVVKGKVGEFKVDSKNKPLDTKVVASPADLKMQDYKAKAPTVRYKELQEILILKK